jgi:putative transcriptional regulator
MLWETKIPNLAFASAVASQMYEGFKPTYKGISVLADYADGKITIDELAEIAKKKLYV